ncbi:MAG: PAS domain-containing protein, partial [Oscillospiraceae bacterium]
FGSNNDGYDFHINQRDLEFLLNVTTDYVAKLACTEPVKMLYFNEKCVEFIGVPAEILASPTYDALSQIYPEDLDKVREVLENTKHDKKSFSVTCRFLHYDGHVFPVRMDGIYVNELYENKYPVLYVLCFKM